MVETAEKSTADAQESHSPSKVAEQLGEYWGEGYAKGILKTKTQVQNAIRALVEESKLTLKDLSEDAVHTKESENVYSNIINVTADRNHEYETEAGNDTIEIMF